MNSLGEGDRVAFPAALSIRERLKVSICRSNPVAQHLNAMPKRKHKGSVVPACAPGELEASVKVVEWAAAGGREPTLSLALKPLVLLRAAKYQLDAPPGHRRQPQAAKKRLTPLEPSAAELSRAVQLLQRLAGQAEELLSPAYKPLRAALHPLVESHLHEQRASPAFRTL